MTSDEALLTIAEIAIATIGFAGIVSALRPKAAHAADAMHRLRLRLMVEASATVMIYAFLPFVLAGVFSEQRIWAIGSGILAFTSPIHVGSIYSRQRRLFGSTLVRETLLFDTTVIVMAAGVEAVLILNCLGVLFQPRNTDPAGGVWSSVPSVKSLPALEASTVKPTVSDGGGVPPVTKLSGQVPLQVFVV